MTVQHVAANMLSSPVFIASLGTSLSLTSFKYIDSNASLLVLESSALTMVDVEVSNVLSSGNLIKVMSATNVTVDGLTMVMCLYC